MKIYLFLLCTFSLLLTNCNTSTSYIEISGSPIQPKMCGVNFVAPPKPFKKNPMPDVQAVEANWVAVIPYAYTLKDKEPAVHYNTSKWQWWGERPEGALRTIELAKAANLNVVLKPQVYIPGGWTGDLNYGSDKEWEQWEKDYEAYILPFVEMADSMNVQAFCIGTEFKKGVVRREAFWRALIKKIRAQYKGKLIYAANWDEYDIVPFWDALDYAGVNAYFPLIDDKTPSVEKLKEAWIPHRNALATFYKKIQKPIVFTEFGYLSVDGCAYNTWELEKNIDNLAINDQAQANAIHALFEVFWLEPFWAGSFIWKWFPNDKGHEGYFQKDYTPQGKIGWETLKAWYGKE